MTKFNVERIELRIRAWVAMLIGFVLFFISVSLLPRGPWETHGMSLLNMAVLTGAVLCYGRAMGAVAWIAGILVAFLVNKAAHSFPLGRVHTVENIWLSTVGVVVLAYVAYCTVRHRPCNRTLVMASLVAVWTVMTADFLFERAFWMNVGAIPASVLVSWLIALISGIVVGYSLFLASRARHGDG